MKLTSQKSTLKQIKSDAVVFFVSEETKSIAKQLEIFPKQLKNLAEKISLLENFKGKNDEICKVYANNAITSPFLLLVGVGKKEKFLLEMLRRASATALNKAKHLKAKKVAFDFSSSAKLFSQNSSEEITQAIVEGAMLSQYKFDKYFSEKKDKEKISEVILFDVSDETVKKIKSGISIAKIICVGTILARDLQNAPSNEIYPETLAAAAQSSAKEFGFECEVWEKSKIEEEKFGGLLAVSSGSVKEPRFIILKYNGTQNTETQPFVFVGKGVTFDSGGISIKPAANMAEMKMDMSGAAAVIGAVQTIARLKLLVNVVGLIPATENMPSGTAVKPGDVVTHRGGKTSEVDNTDAEGRLILADALAFAETLKPQFVIDLATLTGACVVALGHFATGMMGNDDELMNKLKVAGEKTYERVWQLPLFDEYEKLIKSDIADVKNVGGRWGGAITAGWFLKKFIGDYKWVHLDIAGPAILEDNQSYAPKGGSGVGVRLLVELVKSWK
ncbi:MAG: leucyl aminopeptidase [Ignavibacteriales bacterium]|nr:leucyl aminopeptidase [Ignavibacteriales bacterium]